MENKYGIRMHHVMIHVRNIDETAKLYKELFGFELKRRDGYTENKGTFPPTAALLGPDGFVIEIYETENARPFSEEDYEYTLGVKHFSFQVDKLDEFVEMLRKRDDVELLLYAKWSPKKIGGKEDGNGVCWFRDNNGILIELNEEYEPGK